MARQRDPRRDEALKIFKQHNGDVTNRAIAEQLDVPEKTISAWKSRDKWNVVLQTNECSTTNETAKEIDVVEVINDKPPKKDGRVKKRSGNPNPQNQFTKRNRAAMIHGLRSKFLFDEQVEIMEALQDFDVVDQLWLQIELSFSAIIRAQKIMWVEDPFDHLKEISGEMDAEGMSKTDYKVIYAHERYESYIKAQTRAFAEHRNLVKQFLDLTTEDDERRLKLEQMKVSIEKTKAETDFAEMRAAKLRGNKKDTSMLDALVEGRKQYQAMKEKGVNE
ncbi:phage terminase small subunit [Lysinibacillus xylanilyticus]|uniref:phage terminase small subunit n=1 Tax=Lysinibacillus xylanilyticus TaxID=582475 RepID=UPI003822AECB